MKRAVDIKQLNKKVAVPSKVPSIQPRKAFSSFVKPTITTMAVLSTKFAVPRISNIITSTSTSMMPIRKYSSEDEDFQPRMDRGERRPFARRERGEFRERRERPPMSPIITVRGLSEAKATPQELGNLLSGLNVVSVTPIKDSKGKYLNVCFIEMASGEDSFAALRSLRTVSSPTEPMSSRPSSAEERSQATAEASQPTKVIAVKRIPFHASEDDIRNVFPGMNIVSLSVGNGQAFVKFATAEEAKKALEKNGTDFGRRPLVVTEAMAYEHDFHSARPIRMVRIRGAPATATEQDFRQFFDGLDINSVTITTREGISGRTVPGDAFVEFASPEHLQQALKYDRQSMGDRYLQVFRSSPRERRMRLENVGRRPTQSQEEQQ